MKFGTPLSLAQAGVIFTGFTALPTFPYTSPLYSAQGFSSIIVAPTEVWSAGSGTPTPRHYVVTWYADAAGTRQVTADSAWFSDTNGAPGPSANFLWLKVKGASFRLGIAASGALNVQSLTVQVLGSPINPTNDLYYQDNAYFGVSGFTHISDATDKFWAVSANAIAFGNPLVEYPPTRDGPMTLTMALDAADANGVRFSLTDASTGEPLGGIVQVTAISVLIQNITIHRRPLQLTISQLVGGASTSVRVSGVYQN